MPDMLNTAVSGLLTFQRSLTTVSHNIANVNTDGYSRQSTEIRTQTPSFYGNTFFGNGVRVESVTRAYDQFLTQEVRDTTSDFSRLNKFSELAAHIDDVLADPQGGISPSLQEFFASVQDVADDPTSSTARIAMIDSAQILADQFHSIDNRFEQLAENTATNIKTVVSEINDLVVAIRDINVSLSSSYAFGKSTQQSADLLDKRDALLNELAEKIDVTVVNEADNQLSIFVGNGQAMLTGTSVFTLSAQPNPADPTEDVITYNGLVNIYDLSSQLTGGELGGLLDFRQNVLEPTRNALGRVAIGIADTFNTQMRDGMDLNGNLGQDFFSFNTPQIFGFASNLGTATITGVVSDVGSMTIDNYEFTFDGANWTITSDSGTSATVANGAPATLLFEGITYTINGAAAVANDRFTVKPTLDGAESIQVIIGNPDEIAAALPIRTSASLSNLGDVDISPGIITDVTNANLLNTATFTFDNPATTFTSNVDVVVGGLTILAGAPITYSNNMVIDANGWQVSLDGVPQANDVLSVESNAGGVGDNRNALNLANLQNTRFFDGGRSSYQEDYSTLVGFVGSQTRAAIVERDSQQTLLTQAVNRRSTRASVNLDEEAADLIRFQQAYEASARIISTVQVMFDTLLNSVR